MGDRPERLSAGKLILFALGQMGWSLASFGVGSLVIYFYLPPERGSSALFPPFIFQGVVFGVLTIIGIISFAARLVDAVTNPLIASWSDRSRSRIGRRRLFMAFAAFPFALFSALVFLPLKRFHVEPSPAESWLNLVWLSATILAFYFFFVLYCAPYSALISEFGHTPRERLRISTAISFTWALGFATGNMVYALQGLLEARFGLDPVGSFQAVQCGFAVLSFLLMLLPVLFIDERRYAERHVATERTYQAAKGSLANGSFSRFITAELMYTVGKTIIQLGIVYYVTTLLRLPKEVVSFLVVVMFVVSFALYPVVNAAAVHFGKKRVLVLGFALLSLLFPLFAVMRIVEIPSLAFAYGATVLGAIPLAIFGILPNAVLADIAAVHGMKTGSHQAGMFFGIRAFEVNLGVSIANVIFPSLLTLGMSAQRPLGIQLSAFVASTICLLGLLVFLGYNEREILRVLAKKERLSATELRAIGGGPDADVRPRSE